MSNKFTLNEWAEMEKSVYEHFIHLKEKRFILEKEDGYYFATKDDPFSEKPKHKLKTLEYVIWNLAYKTYKGIDNG